MPIDSVSGVSTPPQYMTVSRPPETTPDAREAADQENDARRVAASSQSVSRTETRVNVTPAADAELSFQQASSEISRDYQGGEPSAAQMRAASEAYQAEAAARDQMAQTRQQGGVRSADVLA